MGKIKIIVCCHKDDIRVSSDVYIPLHVGKALSNINLDIKCDNTGDNISHKNGSFCELTGLYWAWKNVDDADYIGLCHYRRYFDFQHIGRKGFPFTTLASDTLFNTDFSVSKEIMDSLENGYVILPKEWNLRYSVYLEYCEHHYSRDFRILGDVIKEFSPKYYYDAILNTMIKSNHLMPFNMFIMSKDQLDNYCNWLFPILFEVERRIDITNYDDIQKRIFGYMGERMLNIYVAAESLKVKQIPILKFSDEGELYDMSLLKYKFRCWANDFALKLTSY